MTLREIYESDLFGPLFYRQSWWLNEPFANDEREHPDRVTALGLAQKYLAHPHSPIWRRFIWTDDHDRHGNRVYVAGVGQDGCAGFQVHRHLVPDERWAEWHELKEGAE